MRRRLPSCVSLARLIPFASVTVCSPRIKNVAACNFRTVPSWFIRSVLTRPFPSFMISGGGLSPDSWDHYCFPSAESRGSSRVSPPANHVFWPLALFNLDFSLFLLLALKFVHSFRFLLTGYV
jgi:hypothetical protein